MFIIRGIFQRANASSYPTLPRRVLVVLYQPGQTEVCDLAHQVVAHQDVGGAQVPVDVVHPLDERHAVGDLRKTKSRMTLEKRILEGVMSRE